MLAHSTHRYLTILLGLDHPAVGWHFLQSSIGATAFICGAVKHYLVIL